MIIDQQNPSLRHGFSNQFQPQQSSSRCLGGHFTVP
jgi:hypothetical protein